MYIANIVLVWALLCALPFAQKSCVKPIPNPPKEAYCGKNVIIKPPLKILTRFRSCTGDYFGCYSTCANIPGCVSFSYDPNTHLCTLYGTIPHVVPDPKSHSVFYDSKKCFYPPRSCPLNCLSPAGCQWAEYRTPPPDVEGSGYPSFDPTVFKTMIPNVQSVTSVLSGFPVSNYQPPASVPSPNDNVALYGTNYYFYNQYFAVDHKCYLKAPVSGKYTFYVYNYDNIVCVWVGGTAYSGWNRANCNIEAAYPYPPEVQHTFSYTFYATQNQHVAFRVMFGQGGGPLNFNMSLVGPTGIVFDPFTGQNIFQYSNYPPANAPQFPAWGQET